MPEPPAYLVRLYDMIYSNDMQLLVDIIEDVIDKDMGNHQREMLVNLLYQILTRGEGEARYETIHSICKNLNNDPETLTEKAQELVTEILEMVGDRE